jgi:hypothetical protein
LLESLLDSRQLVSWRNSGRFEVDVPSGSVELGNLYHLRYRRPGRSDAIVCVVPKDHTTLPVEDIWTNLLLMLRTDPAEFFRVANYRTAR